ncbi:hypothetical protein STEG23_038315, partial [Scotinomys teguina]
MASGCSWVPGGDWGRSCGVMASGCSWVLGGDCGSSQVEIGANPVTAILVKGPEKLMLGQILTVTATHTVEALLRDATNQWMSNACLTQYQVRLLDKNKLTFDKCLAINPTTLLLDEDPEEPIHDCLEILDIIQ